MKRKHDPEDAKLLDGHSAKRQAIESEVEQLFRKDLFDTTILRQYTQEYSISRP